MMTPAEVTKKLNISGSTLRKYAIEFEKEGIIFQRNNKNARLFTVTEAEAIHNATKAAQSGLKSFEDAVSEAIKSLKGQSTITTENAVMESPTRRHDDSAAAVTDEVRGLREEIRKRDSLFVEVLEKMEQKIDRIEQQRTNENKVLLEKISELQQQLEQQAQLNAPTIEEPKVNASEAQPQQQPVKKKGFFSRLFKK